MSKPPQDKKQEHDYDLETGWCKNEPCEWNGLSCEDAPDCPSFCICAEWDGKGLSTCGFRCQVHYKDPQALSSAESTGKQTEPLPQDQELRDAIEEIIKQTGLDVISGIESRPVAINAALDRLVKLTEEYALHRFMKYWNDDGGTITKQRRKSIEKWLRSEEDNG